ncbi:MAG: hypothetical protein ACJASC_002759 [Limimaricola cinnabarinus]|jgi:hypothetical protein|uniref:hypothetical protein n=1 Tax=Limimaricola cinnabarinus TaxID=1125964 RepID=UPI0039E2151F
MEVNPIYSAILQSVATIAVAALSAYWVTRRETRLQADRQFEKFRDDRLELYVQYIAAMDEAYTSCIFAIEEGFNKQDDFSDAYYGKTKESVHAVVRNLLHLQAMSDKVRISAPLSVGSACDKVGPAFQDVISFIVGGGGGAFHRALTEDRPVPFLDLKSKAIEAMYDDLRVIEGSSDRKNYYSKASNFNILAKSRDGVNP